MMVTDPVADLLTRIRNANTAWKDNAEIPFSKLNEQLIRILKKERFIKDYQLLRGKDQNSIRVLLKYGPQRERAITGLRRISKPGLRNYVSKDRIPRYYGGIALVILSTSKGVLTDKEARQQGLGGEVMCSVW